MSRISAAWGFQQLGETSCWNKDVKTVISPLTEQCEETKQGFPTIYPCTKCKAQGVVKSFQKYCSHWPGQGASINPEQSHQFNAYESTTSFTQASVFSRPGLRDHRDQRPGETAGGKQTLYAQYSDAPCFDSYRHTPNCPVFSLDFTPNDSLQKFHLGDALKQ